MKTMRIVLSTVAAMAAFGLTTPAPTAPLMQQPDLFEQGWNSQQAMLGIVEAVNPTLRYVVVNGQVLYISHHTRITRGGELILFNQLREGDPVQVMFRQALNGWFEALAVDCLVYT